MKSKMYLAFMAFAALSFSKSNAQSSNRTLSNLTSPTAINESLLPNVDAAADPDNAKDLGSLSKSWQSLFLSGRLYLNDSIAIHARGAGNFFSGLSAGNISYKGQYNTGIGSNALHSLVSGMYNTAVGFNSLYKNTSGSNNKAAGYYALYANTSGRDNTADGYLSLYNTTTGSYNTGSGSWALYSNTSGNNNVAYGYSALWQNKTGNDNTAIGKYVMYNNVTGYSNIALGTGALYKNTNGFHLVAIGDSALFNFNTTDYFGGSNTAIGSKTLYSTTTGVKNTAIGQEALKQNTTGTGNTAVGFSLVSNTTGSYNTATGHIALNGGTGSYNTAMGYSALFGFAGSYNTAIGANAGGYVMYNEYSNSTAIGYNADVWQSNQVRLGNEAVTSIGGQVGWTILSDGRYKREIKENVAGLAFINSLRPITYTVDTRRLKEYFTKGKKQPDENEALANERIKAVMDKATEAAGKVVHNGFVAQEVEAAARKLGFEFSGVDKPQEKDGLYGLRYDNFVVPLVKAVQELSKKNDELAIVNDELKSKIINLEMEMHELKTMITGKQLPSVNNQLSSASLSQNIPNPFTGTTTIHYNLSQQFATAQIVITDNNGKTIKQVNISPGAGKGTVNVDAFKLSQGIYNYSLIADGRFITTKQMMVAK